MWARHRVARGGTADTFSNLTSASGPYTFTQSGIAWPSDSSKYGVSQYSPSQVLPPPNWAFYNKYADVFCTWVLTSWR